MTPICLRDGTLFSSMPTMAPTRASHTRTGMAGISPDVLVVFRKFEKLGSINEDEVSSTQLAQR